MFGRSAPDGPAGSWTLIAAVAVTIIVAAGSTEDGCGWAHRMMHLQVLVRRTGRPVSKARMAAREIAHLADAVTFIGFLWPWWDRNRQTFADKLAGTIVVDRH